MEIVCKYSTELESFLREVVQYTLNEYGEGLKLSRLKRIELMDKSEFEIAKDGSMCEEGTKIIVTSRLYDLLPTYDIDELLENLEFKMIVSTMYHEMVHVSDWCDYPKIYAIGDAMEDMKNALPALFWLEYLAEKRSCKVCDVNKKEFCEQFVNNKWHSYKSDWTSFDTSNFFYLNKVIPYFLAGITEKETRNYYLNRIDNKLLVEYIQKLFLEVEKLEQLLPFDDIDKLRGLYEIMDEYFKKFRSEFTPRPRNFFR